MMLFSSLSVETPASYVRKRPIYMNQPSSFTDSVDGKMIEGDQFSLFCVDQSDQASEGGRPALRNGRQRQGLRGCDRVYRCRRRRSLVHPAPATGPAQSY